MPRVLFFDVTEKLPEPPPPMLLDTGLIRRLLGPEAVTVLELLTLNATVPVVPPFFFIEIDEGFAVTVQPPEPLPTIGGGGVPPPLPPQSAVLLRTVVPVTTMLE